MTAHVFNDAVLVTGIYRIKGVEKAKPYSRRERFIDTWVRRSNTWICVATLSNIDAQPTRASPEARNMFVNCKLHSEPMNDSGRGNRDTAQAML